MSELKSWGMTVLDIATALAVFGLVYWLTDQRVKLDIGIYLAVMALQRGYRLGLSPK